MWRRLQVPPISRLHRAAHLDLDTIAWEMGHPGVRADFEASKGALLSFIERSESWVVEGGYSELLKVAAKHCMKLIFLNPGTETCVVNCRARPFEAHKYANPEAHDARLALLIEWVREYETRDDEFSLRERRRLFDSHEESSSTDQTMKLYNDCGMRIAECGLKRKKVLFF